MSDKISKSAEGEDFHCGYATLIGRPNVGKSTLLNSLVGHKISITSRKPQTTQRRLCGINTGTLSQVIYVDTPGLQHRYHDVLNQFMTREVHHALVQIDVIIFVIEALKWNREDEEILSLAKNNSAPVILAINKIDRIEDRRTLLPFMDRLAGNFDFADMIPISARKGIQLDILEKSIRLQLPPGAPLYPEEQLTDRNMRFVAAEFIREKLINRLGKEVPYKLTVTIEKYREEDARVDIDAVIWVETRGQKSMVIGKQGEVMKAVGEKARKDLEKLLDQHVFLRTWVKVRKNWTDNVTALDALGYRSE